MESLTGLAQSVTKLFHVQCTFCCDEEVLINEQATATHLFRITQEAVNNAVKHGQADKVLITLKNGGEGVSLSIRDNGIGIPRELPATRGMGMQIMNHRAEVIGAWITIRRAGKRGTVVTCTLPARLT
jgi:two-component system, LuxR family, sensor kinase FixL